MIYTEKHVKSLFQHSMELESTIDLILKKFIVNFNGALAPLKKGHEHTIKLMC